MTPDALSKKLLLKQPTMVSPALTLYWTDVHLSDHYHYYDN